MGTLLKFPSDCINWPRDIVPREVCKLRMRNYCWLIPSDTQEMTVPEIIVYAHAQLLLVPSGTQEMTVPEIIVYTHAQLLLVPSDTQEITVPEIIVYLTHDLLRMR